MPIGEGGDLNSEPQQEEEEIPDLGEADNLDGVDLGEPDFLDPWKLNGKDQVRGHGI
jgi:hypothetical protein